MMKLQNYDLMLLDPSYLKFKKHYMYISKVTSVGQVAKKPRRGLPPQLTHLLERIQIFSLMIASSLELSQYME